MAITIIGTTNWRDKKNQFGIKQKDRRHHIYVVGKTGMGKTTLLENMIIQDIEQGRGVGVLDPHGDLAQRLLDFVPRRRIISGNYTSPVWSPDGQQIVFINEDNEEIYLGHSDGTNIRRPTYNDTYEFNLAWSVDGQAILFYISGQGLYKVSTAGGQTSLICHSK